MIGNRSAMLARLATLVADGAAERPLTVRLALAGRELLRADGASISVDSTTPNRVMLAATDQVAQILESSRTCCAKGHPGMHS